MSRYLTPAKIGLLALIELYVEQAVPNDAILPVLGFLTSHILDVDLIVPPNPNNPRSLAATNHGSFSQSAAGGASATDTRHQWQRAESVIGLVVSIKDFETVLLPFAAADRIPGRRLWDRFLEKLWGIDSLNALQEFFERRTDLLARTKEELRAMAEAGEEVPPRWREGAVLLGRNSPFGAFVRRVSLEFARLQFNHSAELWKAFVKYRQPTAGYWRRRNPQYGRLSFDSVLMTGEHEWGGAETEELAVAAYGDMLLEGLGGGHGEGGKSDRLPVSTDDVDNLLEYQVEQIQKYGVRIPRELKEQFKRLSESSHTQPILSHYLKYSDASRAADLPTSFDALHHYFDYNVQTRDRLFYQYALMNLGVLQAEFGWHKEAVATMLEAVQTARENSDNTCLNFALNWFFHFGRAHPGLVAELENNSMLGTGKETLVYLRAKAKESGMDPLWSSTLLSEAKLLMSNGESVATAMEQMVKSSQLIVSRNMLAMMGPQLSIAATLWDRLGVAYMSGMTSEVFLRVHARNAVFDDELKVTCRLAGQLAGKGRYEEAFAKIESLDRNALRSVKPSQHWHVYRGLLKLRRDLHRNDLVAAEQLLAQLLQAAGSSHRGGNGGGSGLEPDMALVVDSLHIEMLTRKGDYETAFNKIDRLITELREDNRDIALRVRLLLNKAHLFDVVGRPQRGFTVAMRAASLAWRARLLPLVWQAVGALANILNELGEYEGAANLLVAVLPRCLETDSRYTAGELYALLADSWMGMAGDSGGGAEDNNKKTGTGTGTGGGSRGGGRVECMKKANEVLDSALKHFAAVEDFEKRSEMLAKKATIMKSLGDEKLAEDYAARYLALRREQKEAAASAVAFGV